MAFSKSYKRFTLTHEHVPGWQPGSFWRFRTDNSDRDDDVASELVTESILAQVTVGQVQDALNEGRDLNEFLQKSVTKRDVLNAKRAFLIAKTDCWGGFDHMVDADYQDDTQEAIGKDEETGEPIYPLHEDAGRIAPVTPFWVGQEEPEVIDIVYDELMKRMQGRSASEQAEFPDSAASVDGPRRRAKRSKEAPVPA